MRAFGITLVLRARITALARARVIGGQPESARAQGT